MRAVGVHYPKIAGVGVGKSYLRTVGRNGGIACAIAQLVKADSDDRDDPDTVFLLRSDGAADQELGSILEPFDARSTEAKRVGNG